MIKSSASEGKSNYNCIANIPSLHDKASLNHTNILKKNFVLRIYLLYKDLQGKALG